MCPRCGATSDGSYCPRCGLALVGPAMPFACPRCGTGYFGNFCPTCGAPSYTPLVPMPYAVREPRAWMKELFTVGWLIAVVLYGVLVLMNLGTLAYATGVIVPGILEQDPTGCGVGVQRFECRAHLYLVSPFPLVADGGEVSVFVQGVRLYGLAFLTWFILLVWTILASHIFLAWRDGRLTLRDLRQGTRDLRAPFWSHSSWLTLAQVFSVVMFFDMVYFNVVLPAVGISAEPPEVEGLPTWFLLYNLAFASVYEELLLRVAYLGLLLGVLMVLVASATRTTAGLRPVDYFLGGKFTLNRYSLGPWVFSAVLFGLAHVLGGAWEPWKFVDTLVAGFVLGYLFLRRGLAAAIMLHFTIDYLGATSIIIQDNPTSGSLALTVFIGLAILAFSIIGFFFFIKYAREAVERVSRSLGLARPRGRPAAAADGAASPAPSPWSTMGWNPTGYMCSKCGSQEARHAEGHLQCARCGNLT